MTAMDGGERLDEGPAALNSVLERPHADGRARPLEEKQKKNSSADLWYQRGWTPPNTEKAVVAAHLVNLAYNGLSGLEGSPTITPRLT